MYKQPPHVVEQMGYVVVFLVLLGFLLVGQFVPNPAAATLDALLEVFALLGVLFVALGRWGLR